MNDGEGAQASTCSATVGGATNRFGQFRVYLYDADRSAPPQPLTGLRYGPVVAIAWSPNGRKLLLKRTAG